MSECSLRNVKDRAKGEGKGQNKGGSARWDPRTDVMHKELY